MSHPGPRGSKLPWTLLLAGIALLVLGQILFLAHGSALAATDTEGTTQSPLVGFVADDIVAPLLRASGDPAPTSERVSSWIRYLNFAIMLIGLALVFVGARGLQLARIRTTRRRSSG